jgi:hypothetical protein
LSFIRSEILITHRWRNIDEKTREEIVIKHRWRNIDENTSGEILIKDKLHLSLINIS